MTRITGVNSVIKIGIIVKTDSRAGSRADEFEAWLKARNIAVIRKESILPNRGHADQLHAIAPPDLSCVFVLGGDGTFLSAVRWIGNQDIPILGVKFGEVGFLAGIVADNLFDVAENILNGIYSTELRMRLLVTVLRKGRVRFSETVLNDIVINKGALARLAQIKTYIDDHYLTTYRADGLIVSTPTGSTAYALAAGGPVIHPAVPGIIMTPICPFTLTNRPLVVPEHVRIKLRLSRGASDIMLTFDGQAGLDIDDKDEIIVCKGAHPTRIITPPGQQYFDILKEKLRWSGSRV
ncbi:MAG: NAD(+) kinase [Desulfobacteraceae bacterium 4572_123]|nr:MAG: NAD(+) kinase [Desulfobacteraceae bacterium 4572_123]